jgi:hypothetical protein
VEERLWAVIVVFVSRKSERGGEVLASGVVDGKWVPASASGSAKHSLKLPCVVSAMTSINKLLAALWHIDREDSIVR